MQIIEGFHDEDAVKRMKYNQLGETDLIVSKLSLGGGPFGELYNTCNQEIVNNIVENGLKRGINFIDTSYWYGQGKSETRIGKALSNLPRSSYYLGTKVGRWEHDVEHRFDFRADTILKNFEHSLIRLGLPSIDLLQIHDVEFADNEKIILEETLPALQKLKDLGKTRYIGITGYPLNVLSSILQKSTIHVDTILTYCHATLNDSTLSEYLPLFQEKKVGVINAAAVSLGLLTPQGPPHWHPAHNYIKTACKEAVDYCKEVGVSVAKLALNYSMNFPGVHTTLAGMDRVELLDECIESATSELTPHEAKCMDTVKTKYFQINSNYPSPHWEGVELERYLKKLKERKAHVNN